MLRLGGQVRVKWDNMQSGTHLLIAFEAGREAVGVNVLKALRGHTVLTVHQDPPLPKPEPAHKLVVLCVVVTKTRPFQLQTSTSNSEKKLTTMNECGAHILSIPNAH
jgi:hypothetical protein